MIKQFTFGSESGQRFKLKVNECHISVSSEVQREILGLQTET